MDPAAILALIRDLDFPRFAGSEGERRARGLVAAWLTDVGLQATREPLTAPWVEVVEASIAVAGEFRPLFPIEELMQQTAVWGPPPDLEAEGVLWPVEDLGNAPSGAPTVVVHCRPDAEAARLRERAAQLFLFNETLEVHPYVVSVHPSTPPAYVRGEGREWVLSHLGDRARVEWRTAVSTRTFANLRADIPGKSAETILLGALVARKLVK